MNDSSANNASLSDVVMPPSTTGRLRRYTLRAVLTGAGLAAVMGLSYLLSLMG